jgi:hypothetical protein
MKVRTSGVVVHAGLGEHRVVLDFGFTQRRAVVGDDHELGLSGAERLEHGLVSEGVLSGPVKRKGRSAREFHEARVESPVVARRRKGGGPENVPHDNLETVVDAVILLALLLGLDGLGGGRGSSSVCGHDDGVELS